MLDEFMFAFTFMCQPLCALLKFQLKFKVRLININVSGLSFRSLAAHAPVQGSRGQKVTVDSLMLMRSCLNCEDGLINVNELKLKLTLRLTLINVNVFVLSFNHLPPHVQVCSRSTSGVVLVLTGTVRASESSTEKTRTAGTVTSSRQRH